MKAFLKMTIGILCICFCAKMAECGFSAPNSSAADIYFTLSIISVMTGLYCFLGDLFE